MKYQWILFDADETLFSFNSFEGLKRVLVHYNLPFEWEDYQQFQAVNKPLWVAYQNKEITAQELQITRFAELAKKTGQDALKLNLELMMEMAEVSQPLAQTMSILTELHGKVKMGIITNGFKAMQQKRLENTKTLPFFEFLVVSEEAGVAKPDPKIFELAFEKMDEVVDKSKVLMVGDTLSSDILGANNSGIDSCWFNPEQHSNDTSICPTYEIHSMQDLISIIYQ